MTAGDTKMSCCCLLLHCDVLLFSCCCLDGLTQLLQLSV